VSMKSQLLLPYLYDFLENIDVEGFDEMYDYAIKRDVPSVSKSVGGVLSFFVRLLKPSSVLELGSGIGVAAKFILTACKCKYTGVDNNLERIDVAKRFLKDFDDITFLS